MSESEDDDEDVDVVRSESMSGLFFSRWRHSQLLYVCPEELRKQFQLFWVIGELCQEAEKFTFLTVTMLLILVYDPYSMAFHE